MTTLPERPARINPAPLPRLTTTPDDHAGHHEAAVAEIVGMIVAAIQGKGERNLAIGAKALEHARWQRLNGPTYDADDYNRLMRRIRDDVRLHIPIKPASIRIDDWALAAELRELLRPVVGEAAGLLTFHELRTLAPKVMAFSKRDVAGELRPEWVETIRGIATDRAVGRTVGWADLLARVRANADRIADATPDAPRHQLSPAEAARRAENKARAEANAAVTSSLHDALASKAMTPEQALAIVEAVTRSLDLPAPDFIGFQPATATVADCETLAEAMAGAGRVGEMRRLYDRLGSLLSRGERARRAAGSPLALARL